MIIELDCESVGIKPPADFEPSTRKISEPLEEEPKTEPKVEEEEKVLDAAEEEVEAEAEEEAAAAAAEEEEEEEEGKADAKVGCDNEIELVAAFDEPRVFELDDETPVEEAELELN